MIIQIKIVPKCKMNGKMLKIWMSSHCATGIASYNDTSHEIKKATPQSFALVSRCRNTRTNIQNRKVDSVWGSTKPKIRIVSKKL